MARRCTIGLEIEIIAQPHHRTSTSNPQTYVTHYRDELVTALRSQGLQAAAWRQGLPRKNPSQYDKWWLTWDGSLFNGPPASGAVPFEAVSPIMDSRYGWETQVDGFWRAYNTIFQEPNSDRRCGSHVHLKLPNGFSLSQLKKIACGIAFHKDEITKMLPPERRGNTYCKQNWDRSAYLNRRSMNQALNLINSANNVQDLIWYMQGEVVDQQRYVLWNFQNITGNSGTIEFRGGRCLRGRHRTKWWIAFAVGFMFFCLENNASNMPNHYTTRELYRQIKIMAQQLGMAHLPDSWQELNETPRWQINERGVANIVPSGPTSKHDVVEGLVFGIDADAEERLDVFEGVKRGFYQQVEVMVDFVPIGDQAKTIFAAQDLEAGELGGTSSASEGGDRGQQSGSAQGGGNPRGPDLLEMEGASVRVPAPLTRGQPESTEKFVQISAVTYLSEKYCKDGQMRDEYKARMSAATGDARRLGVSKQFIDIILEAIGDPPPQIEAPGGRVGEEDAREAPRSGPRRRPPKLPPKSGKGTSSRLSSSKEPGSGDGQQGSLWERFVDYYSGK
ncbi:hypothetical protein LTR67_001740 [Exophiala xenobiotica]